MIDPDGDEWLTYADAARAVRVREDRLRAWVSRGKVEARRVGRQVWVHMGDVRRMERGHTEWKRARQGRVMAH